MTEINKNLNDDLKDQGNIEEHLISNQNNNYEQGQNSDFNEDQKQKFNNIQEPLLKNENNPNEISSPNQSQKNLEDKNNQQNNLPVPPPIIDNENNQNITITNNNNFKAKEINQKRDDNVIQNGIVCKEPYTNSQMKYQINYQKNIPLRVQKRKRPWGFKDFFAILIGFALGVGTICLFHILL